MNFLKIALTAALIATAPTAFAQQKTVDQAAANPEPGPQIELKPGGLATLKMTAGITPVGFVSMTRDGTVTYADFPNTVFVTVKGDKVDAVYHISGFKL